MDHVDFVYTVGMSEADVTRKLRESLAGVLSLANDGDAYGIPVSHHYDGDRLLIRLIDDGTSTKMDYLESTSTATFTVFESVAPGDAWSIVVRGTLREFTELDDGSINELFEPVHVFDEDIENVEVGTYVLEVDSISGRETKS